VFTAVRCATSYYAKKVLVGRYITGNYNSYVNNFIFQCKYCNIIGQDPCHAKIRKRVAVKGIAFLGHKSRSLSF
jgi:hypothetical protein